MFRELKGKAAHEGAAKIGARPEFGQRQRKRVIDHAQIDMPLSRASHANNSFQADAAAGIDRIHPCIREIGHGVSSREA